MRQPSGIVRVILPRVGGPRCSATRSDEGRPPSRSGQPNVVRAHFPDLMPVPQHPAESHQARSTVAVHHTHPGVVDVHVRGTLETLTMPMVPLHGPIMDLHLARARAAVFPLEDGYSGEHAVRTDRYACRPDASPPTRERLVCGKDLRLFPQKAGAQPLLRVRQLGLRASHPAALGLRSRAPGGWSKAERSRQRSKHRRLAATRSAPRLHSDLRRHRL